MPKSRPALDALKAELLKGAEPKERLAIGAAFEAFEELLDGVSRIADAAEAIPGVKKH